MCLSLQGDKGQMTAELVIVVPALLLALIVIVNLGMFLVEAARFDRITGEVARVMVNSPLDPTISAQEVLQDSLGYFGTSKGPYTARVKVDKGGDVFLKKRTLTFTLEYRLFAAGVLASQNIRPFQRSKIFVIYWSTGL